MTDIYFEGKKLLRQDRQFLQKPDMPTDLRQVAEHHLETVEHLAHHPQEAIRFLLQRIESLRLALGSIAYTERGDLTAEEALQAVRRSAKQAADWADKLPDDEPRLAVVK